MVLSKQQSTMQLILLGEEATSKTRVRNTIMGQLKDQVLSSSVQMTFSLGTVGGRELIVVDTPGFEEDCSPDVPLQILKNGCNLKSLDGRGFHVVLLTIPIWHEEKWNQRFAQRLSVAFGQFDENIWKHTMILFTRAELLDSGGLERYLQNQGKPFQSLVKKCGNRYHAINFRMNGRLQVKQLLENCEQVMSENNGSTLNLCMNDGQDEDVSRKLQEQALIDGCIQLKNTAISCPGTVGTAGLFWIRCSGKKPNEYPDWIFLIMLCSTNEVIFFLVLGLLVIYVCLNCTSHKMIKVTKKIGYQTLKVFGSVVFVQAQEFSKESKPLVDRLFIKDINTSMVEEDKDTSFRSGGDGCLKEDHEENIPQRRHNWGDHEEKRPQSSKINEEEKTRKDSIPDEENGLLSSRTIEDEENTPENNLEGDEENLLQCKMKVIEEKTLQTNSGEDEENVLPCSRMIEDEENTSDGNLGGDEENLTCNMRVNEEKTCQGNLEGDEENVHLCSRIIEDEEKTPEGNLESDEKNITQCNMRVNEEQTLPETSGEDEENVLPCSRMIEHEENTSEGNLGGDEENINKYKMGVNEEKSNQDNLGGDEENLLQFKMKVIEEKTLQTNSEEDEENVLPYSRMIEDEENTSDGNLGGDEENLTCNMRVTEEKTRQCNLGGDENNVLSCRRMIEDEEKTPEGNLEGDEENITQCKMKVNEEQTLPGISGALPCSRMIEDEENTPEGNLGGDEKKHQCNSWSNVVLKEELTRNTWRMQRRRSLDFLITMSGAEEENLINAGEPGLTRRNVGMI